MRMIDLKRGQPSPAHLARALQVPQPCPPGPRVKKFKLKMGLFRRARKQLQLAACRRQSPYVNCPGPRVLCRCCADLRRALSTQLHAAGDPGQSAAPNDCKTAAAQNSTVSLLRPSCSLQPRHHPWTQATSAAHAEHLLNYDSRFPEDQGLSKGAPRDSLLSVAVLPRAAARRRCERPQTRPASRLVLTRGVAVAQRCGCCSCRRHIVPAFSGRLPARWRHVFSGRPPAPAAARLTSFLARSACTACGGSLA